MFELALSPFPELPEKPASHRRRANSAVLVSRDDSAPSLQKAITSLSIARRSSERDSRRQSLNDENMRSILFSPMTLAHWLPETADIQRISSILEAAHHNGASNACHVDATLVASLSELALKSEVLPVVRIAALRSLGQWVQLDSPDGPPLRDPALTTSVLQLFLLATHEKEPCSLREQATRGIANVLMCDPLAQQLIAQGVKDALLQMLHELGGKLGPGLAEIEQRLLIAVLVALGNLSEIPGLMPQLAQRDVVKQLIAARRISVPAVSLPAGWLICMTTCSFAISLTELEELDVISELLEHSRLEIKCEEEVAWTFAMFAGKIPFQPLISQRADALEFLANLTQQEASIGSCTQALWALANMASSREGGKALIDRGMMDRISTTLDQSTEEPVRQQAARCMSNLLKLREGRDFLLFSTNCSTALAALTTLATPPPSGLAPFVEPAIRGLSNACLPPLEDLPSEVVKCEGLEEALARSLEIATREDAPPRLLSATLTCILNVSTVLRNYPSEEIVMDTFRLASPLVELIGSQSQAIQPTLVGCDPQASVVETLSNFAVLGGDHVLRIVNETAALETLRNLAQTGPEELLPICNAALGSLAIFLTPGSRSLFVQRSRSNSVLENWTLSASVPRRSSPLVSKRRMDEIRLKVHRAVRVSSFPATLLTRTTEEIITTETIVSEDDIISTNAIIANEETVSKE
ncbi:MAG: hypothetical protein SGPRY_007822 [Prymnesium sp.]